MKLSQRHKNFARTVGYHLNSQANARENVCCLNLKLCLQYRQETVNKLPGGLSLIFSFPFFKPALANFSVLNLTLFYCG